MSDNYHTILEDLHQDSERNIAEILPPYDVEATYEEKFTITYRAMQRASRLKRRILLLVNAYYMGRLLELDAASPTERHHYSSRLSQYYRVTSVRLYYIYEHLGIGQLMKSTSMTLTTVRNLSSAEFDELTVEALNIFQRS